MFNVQSWFWLRRRPGKQLRLPEGYVHVRSIADARPRRIRLRRSNCQIPVEALTVASLPTARQLWEQG